MLDPPWIVLGLEGPDAELPDLGSILPRTDAPDSSLARVYRAAPAVLAALRWGASPSAACRSAGLRPGTLAEWGRLAGEGLEPFGTLQVAVEHVQTLAHKELVNAIHRAGVAGGSKRTVDERVGPDGGVTHTVREEQLAPDWRAAAWLLERTMPEDYGRMDRLDVTSAGEATKPRIVFGGVPEELRAKLAAQGPGGQGSAPGDLGTPEGFGGGGVDTPPGAPAENGIES